MIHMPTWCFTEYNSCFGKLQNIKDSILWLVKSGGIGKLSKTYSSSSQFYQKSCIVFLVEAKYHIFLWQLQFETNDDNLNFGEYFMPLFATESCRRV